MSTDFTRIDFRLTGMHCASCAINIDFALEDMDGVKEASTNYAKEISTVTFDRKKLKKEDLISVIESLGYKAR